MTCEQANQVDLVDYLYALGYSAQKTRGDNHWYLSPLRDEKHASFVINRSRNVWYDHGIGKGGKLIDFVMEFHRCSVSEALAKIASFHPQHTLNINSERPPFHSHENSVFYQLNEKETAIKIIAAKQPIEDLLLCRYLHKRCIEKSIADQFCFEVSFKNLHADFNKIYKAIGFKNSEGGYELRNEYFKGSSAPKSVTYSDNHANNVTVFEGFFDFLTYQSIHKNQEQPMTNFLVLNSLSFFEKSLALMERHEHVHLYLDHDQAGRKFTEMALKQSTKFSDESNLYKGYKDVNEWKVNFGKLLQKNSMTTTRRKAR